MTFRPFHRWIEPSSTAATVVLAFGGWWDASSPTNPFLAAWARRQSRIIGGGLI
jgi:hypothetical protein